MALDDTVVREPNLSKKFGDRIQNHVVDNGHRAHDAEPYLNAPVTGVAMAAGLAG